MTTINDATSPTPPILAEYDESEPTRDLPDGFDMPGSPWHVPDELRDAYCRVPMDRRGEAIAQQFADARKLREEWANEVTERRRQLTAERFAQWRAKAMDAVGNPTPYGRRRMLEHSYGQAKPTGLERSVGEHRRLLELAREEVARRQQRADAAQLRVQLLTCELCGIRQELPRGERRPDPLMRSVPGTEREARLCDACWPVVDAEARRSEPLNDGRTRVQAAREWLGVDTGAGAVTHRPQQKVRGHRRRR